MAYKTFDELGSNANAETPDALHFDATAKAQIALPDVAFIKDAEFSRDGQDLILKTADSSATIENYFSTGETPSLIGPEGNVLTPELIQSFTSTPLQYAAAETSSDASPIGYVDELLGGATITRTDGTTEPMTQGMPVFQGDVVETSDDGAVNLVFADESSFAVSEDTRMALDEFVYDPSTESGVQNFSVLKGVFVYTSGLIGREDPDDVQIDTPVGSIGIRGTIIAGDVNTGEITVVEGAIVLTDPNGNQMTLANQYETAKFTQDNGIQNQGQMNGNDMANKFSGVAPVAPDLFSSINDSAGDQPQGTQPQAEEQKTDAADESDQPQEAKEAQGQADDEAQDGEADDTQAAGDAEGQEEGRGEADEKRPDAKAKGEPADAAKDGAAAAEANGDVNPADAPQDKTIPEALHNKDFRDNLNKALGDNDTRVNQPKSQRAFEELKENLGPSEVIENFEANVEELQDNLELDPRLRLGIDDADETGADITLNSIAEGNVAAATTVATIGNATVAGTAANITAVNLLGVAQNFFNIYDNGDGTFDIQTNFADEYDFEDPHGIQFDVEIITDLGPIIQNVDLEVTDVDEGIEHNSSAPVEAFKATGDMTWEFDFSKDFQDQDFETLTFTLDDYDSDFANNTGVSDAIASFNLDSTTGILTVTTNGFGTGVSLNFDIEADNGTSMVDGSYTLYLDPTNESVFVSAGSANINTGGTVFGDDGTVETFIIGSAAGNVNSSKIFGDSGNDTFIIGTAGGYSSNQNLVNGQDGDDYFAIGDSAIENEVLGGGGDDNFLIMNGNNRMHGMDGDDTFVFDNTGVAALGNFLSGSNKLVDGGSGFDKIKFTDTGGTGVNIDIGTSNLTTKIQNIEMLDFTNTESNTVTLNYGDLMAITEDENVLFIKGDSNDTLDFDFIGNGVGTSVTNVVNGAADGNSDDFEMFHEGTFSQGGEEYDIYSSGEVTIMVDTDVSVTGDLAGI